MFFYIFDVIFLGLVSEVYIKNLIILLFIFIISFSNTLTASEESITHRRQLVAGKQFACAILDKKVTCKYFRTIDGNPPFFEEKKALIIEKVPVGMNYPLSLSAGNSYVCAVYKKNAEDLDTHFKCWGSAYAAKNAPTYKKNPKFLATGSFLSCAQFDGKFECWGNLEIYKDLAKIPQQLQDAPKAIMLGDYHGCGMDVNNTVFCWGYDALIPKGSMQTQIPLQVVNPKILYVNSWATCTVEQDDKINCWGSNDWSDHWSWPKIKNITDISTFNSLPHWCVVSNKKVKCHNVAFNKFKDIENAQEIVKTRGQLHEVTCVLYSDQTTQAQAVKCNANYLFGKNKYIKF
ncbi:hypothetical protein N9O57_00080 [bacterium]|nr:hypothetical protein [bacterium]